MKFTKKLSFMMLICCMSQVVQSSDVSDQNGRTPLMNYVINKEIEIKNVKSDLEKLWDTYFYIKKTIQSCSIVDGRAIFSYKKNILNKPGTTDENIAEYKNFEIQLNLLIQNAVEDVTKMVLDGADVHVYDQQGKTVLDYCYTEPMYKALRKFGASSLFTTWAYFNPGEVVINGFVGTVAVIVGAVIYSVCRKVYLAA